MKPPDVQPEPEPEYFDPEIVDMSEQQFSASLEAEPRPDFMLDEEEQESALNEVPETVAPAKECTATIEPLPATVAMPVLLEGPDESHSHEPATPTLVEDSPAQTAVEDWRTLVSAKVNKYKSRRPHQDRYPSLKLQFEPPVYSAASSSRWHEAAESSQEIVVPDPVPQDPVFTVEVQSHAVPAVPVFLESTARVLEFPRPATFPLEDELAEPVVDRPRILEAPELLPAPPAMGGILIDPPAVPEPQPRPGFDIPLKPAALRRRVLAGAIDGLVVASALMVFGWVFVRITGAVPPWRSFAGLTVGLLALFWAAYQYAFLVFSRTSPGLYLTGLRIARFDGVAAPRRVMQWRAIASLLSGFSLGLGYAWCFLDEDQLSWHDRITRTHLAPRL